MSSVEVRLKLNLACLPSSPMGIVIVCKNKTKQFFNSDYTTKRKQKHAENINKYKP